MKLEPDRPLSPRRPPADHRVPGGAEREVRHLPRVHDGEEAARLGGGR
jgi:hypothetical protein